MNCLSTSILAADFSNLQSQIEAVEKGGAQYIHIDVMDGVFVPQISFGMPVMKSIRGVTELVFDVHLMITEPIRYIDEFVKAGADIITVHYEACEDLDATLAAIKDAGVLVGLAISPDTPVDAIRNYIEDVDMILVMSVYPGFGGQKFIPAAFDKLRKIRRIIDENGYKTDVEVDGGVHLGNIDEVLESGANIIVAGSAIFKGDATGNTIDFMEHLRK